MAGLTGAAAASSDTIDLVECHPSALSRRALKGIDSPLHDSALDEIALVLGAAAEDLVGEVPHQVGVEQERPRLVAGATRREVTLRDLLLDELNRVLGRTLDRLADPGLLDQPHDQRALRAIYPRLDPWVVAHRYIRRLDRRHHVRV